MRKTPEPTGSDPVGDYIRKVSELNPMYRAAELIELRSQAFKLPRCDAGPRASAIATAGGDLEQIRQAFKQFLIRIQSQFWQLPQTDLLQQLAAINTQQLPELTAVVQRLRTVAEFRGQFPQLAQERWMVTTLFHAVKTAVVLPQSEAGVVRERFLRSITGRKELKAVQLAVQQIQSHYPVIFEMEKDFFQTLQKFQLHRTPQLAQSNQAPAESNYGWVLLIGAFILLRILFALFRSGSST